MPILFFIVIAAVLLLIGYRTYGTYVAGVFKLDPTIKTPAHSKRDNIDYVPTNKYYLFGQHFSAIAAAGPIVGPIVAGLWFGWLPAVLWILFGGIFIGGVHDMATLIASLRHKGESMGAVIKDTMNHRAFVLFLLFLWFTLVYIITTFTDITAGAFVDPANGPSVASASMMYLGLALIMGIVIKLFKPTLKLATIIFLPLVFVCVYLGQLFPLNIGCMFGLDQRSTWDVLLLVYCFIAALIPVWLVLQPRGYLGGFFLSITVVVSVAGIIIGFFTKPLTINYPAFMGWTSPEGFPLLPVLFTTIACGACSGFHSIVAAGTTSKQIDKKMDVKLVGYGALLLESFVAVIALGTLMFLSKGETANLKDPNQIYANGVATFLSYLGIDKTFALNFALLSFATFVYDTLDVATRLGRLVFEELTGWRGKLSMVVATMVTLGLPVFFVTKKIASAQGTVIPAWKLFWPLFGSANQLLAALALLAATVWLFQKRLKYKVTLFPAVFMLVVAMTSLWLILKPFFASTFAGGKISQLPIIVTGSLLFALAIFIMVEGAKVFWRKRP